MNENKNTRKSDTNGVDPSMLAMLALSNNSGFAAGNIGVNYIIPPASVMNDDENEENLTR